MTELSDEVHALRDQGYTYNAIVAELGCSKGYVAYCVGEGQKQKTLDNQKRRRATNALVKKADNFRAKLRTRVLRLSEHDALLGKTISFTLDELLAKIGANPVCYLTGREVDTSVAYAYSLDHIVPRCRGGDNSLENLGLTVRDANIAKGRLLLPEFLELCKDVLINHGYTVTRMED